MKSQSIKTKVLDVLKLIAHAAMSAIFFKISNFCHCFRKSLFDSDGIYHILWANINKRN